RRARRGPRDPPRVAGARRDPVPLRPDPRHLRGRDRRRARRYGCERGGDRDGDARRQARGGRMSESLAPQTPPEPDTPPTNVAARRDLLHRAGGIAVPVATAVLAFAIGGLVVLASGHNPFLAYRAILNGAGLTCIAHPWNTDTINTAPYNLTQTLLQTTTLILTGLAVAFAFRCGLFNIRRPGQHLTD